MHEFATGHKILDHAEQELKTRGTAALDGLSEKLTEYRIALGADWTEFVRDHVSRHSIQKALHESPFSRRAYEKPRGYPGDAVTIDYAYGLNRLDRASLLGRALYEWEYRSQCCRSVRSRRDLVAKRIDEAALSNPRARILSVACGHLREAQISEAVRESMFDEFLALDQDPDSLAVVQAEHPGIRTVCRGVQTLLTREPEWNDLDFVYAAGLYDYLSDAFARRLTARLFAMVRPGGRLLIANFHPEALGSACMEAWMDWWLIYRTEGQVEALASGINPQTILWQQSFRDGDRNVAYLELVKADCGNEGRAYHG
jgi:extracellular factor (EF) 3-hydroxypalmitic acid methyl ester biosynthesis protein